MRGLHLGSTHVLARIAARHCTGHAAPLIGGVACGPCWERAIRDDERIAVEEQLPRELITDPDLVDEVAVDRAVLGRATALTATERRLAITRLRDQGRRPTEICRLLHTSHSTVARELQRLAQAAASAA